MTALNDYQKAIESALPEYLPAPGEKNPAGKVAEAMRYSLLAGGKRIRPALTLAFCRLCGGDAQAAMPLACAVEMVHTYSLIHDDLPCMDDDDLRRGRPTCHKQYGEAMALLAGDGLLTLAFQTALRFPDPPRAAAAACVLAECAGYQGMVGGQCIDLESVGKTVDLPLLEAMDQGKTVALIQAACQMGVLAAGGSSRELEGAGTYAEGVGMAFQLRDDILDVLGDAERLGKNTGMDSALQKPNYVSLLGVDAAQKLVEHYTAQAVTALEAFSGDTGFLSDLALALAGRES